MIISCQSDCDFTIKAYDCFRAVTRIADGKQPTLMFVTSEIASRALSRKSEISFARSGILSRAVAKIGSMPSSSPSANARPSDNFLAGLIILSTSSPTADMTSPSLPGHSGHVQPIISQSLFTACGRATGV